MEEKYRGILYSRERKSEREREIMIKKGGLTRLILEGALAPLQWL